MKTNLFRKNHSSSKWGMRIMHLALLLLPLLGRGLGGGCVLFAQNGVTVTNLAVKAGSPTTVTFNVSWKTPMPVALWSDTVWVFVDYNKNGVMERLPLFPGATLTATSPGGKVIEEPDNNKGVWVAGNARSAGSFSATVKLLTAIKDVGGACVYGSNYPPVGEYSSNTPILSFTGTPMYDIQLAKPGGESVTVKSGDTFLLPCEYTLTSFSDATGAPGQLNGVPFNGNIPPYAASTQLWTVGSQVWSDVINIPECDHDAFTNSTTVPYCRSYTVNEKKWYYYNWTYVNKNQDKLCPLPWHVPLQADFEALDLALGGTGARHSATQVWINEKYVDIWGGVLGAGRAGGPCAGTQMCQIGQWDHWWSNTSRSSAGAVSLQVSNSIVVIQDETESTSGHRVRCVK